MRVELVGLRTLSSELLDLLIRQELEILDVELGYFVKDEGLKH